MLEIMSLKMFSFAITVMSRTKAGPEDPGFSPLGGGGAPMSDTGAFRRKCRSVRKQKNWVPMGRGWRAALPESANEHVKNDNTFLPLFAFLLQAESIIRLLIRTILLGF